MGCRSMKQVSQLESLKTLSRVFFFFYLNFPNYSKSVSVGCIVYIHYENKPIHLPPKNENFQIKTLIFSHSSQNIDCWYSLEPRGVSNEYPQSMLL